jgi:hypothetical protein
MSTSRRVVLVVSGGLLAAWLASTIGGAGTTSPVRLLRPSPAEDPPAPQPASIDAAKPAAARSPAESSRATRRNLFQFHRVEPPRTPEGAEAVVSAFASAASAMFAPSAPPEWKLIGVAERVDGDARARTAIISGPHDVFLVAEGAQFAGRFEVVRIESESVELRGLADGARLVLSLKPR